MEPLDVQDSAVVFLQKPNEFPNVQDKLSGKSSIFLLDFFPGSKASYSLRQLSSTYFGPGIRVERTSDNTTQDIGFLEDGSLDVASLIAFVGTGPTDNGHTIILYDQSGNGRNLDMSATLSKAPRIIVDGVLQETNALPSLNFDGIDDVLTHSVNPLNSPVDHLFVFGVWKKLELTNEPINFNLNAPEDGGAVGERVSVHAPFSDGRVFWDAGSTVSDRTNSAMGFNDLLQHVYTFTKTAGVNKQIIKRDGTQIAQRTQGTSSTILNLVAIGNFNTTVSIFAAHMQWQELIFYDTDKFNDIETIENNLIEYWLSLVTNWVNGANNMVNGANRLVFAKGV